jgi:hypothetical protein
MQDVLGPVAVAGEQDQPLGVLVQASDRKQARAAREIRRHEIEHGRHRVAVAHGGGHAGGLVDREVDGRSSARTGRPST